MNIFKIIEIIVILLLSYFNYSVCYELFSTDKPLVGSFITAIISFIAVSWSFFSNEGKGYFARIKSAMLTFVIFHISVLIAYFERLGQYEQSTFMEYVVKYIFFSFILQLVASSLFFMFFGLAIGFSSINQIKPKFTNKKEKAYRYSKNNGSDDKGNVVDGDGIIECEDYKYVYDEERGNTESASEQTAFSGIKTNSEIKYNKQSELDEKSKEKDIRQIEYNKENTIKTEVNKTIKVK